MIKELLQNTNAYKVILGDKRRGTLSHAYIVACEDEKSLRAYLKELAKLILCESEEACGSCRVCRLIERETHPDVAFYPKQGEKLKVDAADKIVADSIVRPLEIKNRAFVVERFEDFDKSQNKLLKTLEEPPEGVILLLGSVNTTALLQTVKSRAKMTEIPPIPEKLLYSALSGVYDDKEKLKAAVALSGGKLSAARDIYENGNLIEVENKVVGTLARLKSSRDVLELSAELKDEDLELVISILKLELDRMIKYKSGDISRLSDDSPLIEAAKLYSIGALIEIIEALNELERRLHFNANKTMAIDKMLFSLLEARHKWQKL